MIEEEYGCTEPVRSLSTEDVTAYDTNGNELKCMKCDKPAVCTIMGATLSVSYCAFHAGMSDD